MNYDMDNKAVITSQPYSQFAGGDSTNWVQNPSFTAGFSGFDYLRNVDQLYITYKCGLKDDGCCEQETTTTISNTYGQPVYTGSEEAGCCSGNCEGSSRSFDVKIKDGRANEIGQFLRDSSCAANCCACFKQKLEVYAPLGNLVAVVSQDVTFLAPNYSIRTPDGKKIFDICTPPCTCHCGMTITFHIYRSDDQMKIGEITRYVRAGKELPVEGECYHITFPSLMEIDQKVALLGGLYFLDFLLFERHRHEMICL